MPKEPGERHSEELQDNLIEKAIKRKFATDQLLEFTDVMRNVEEDRIVELDKDSDTVSKSKSRKTGKINFSPVKKETALKNKLITLRGYLDDLNTGQRQVADGLIIRAEIYLAAHEPKKEE